jgi:hypothetical protein
MSRVDGSTQEAMVVALAEPLEAPDLIGDER